ncbi:MAG: elongation factor Ts [Clostridia bacterium]|nr:elongation factor Ts [Clostridia bacterium]MBO7215861.1 elongation factor Ts [Clostridia bacterium]MBO7246243.1 elongation factor Ts [Clostridia bacterium]
MADISAKVVMELRKKTGCGMMECKKALVTANGDFDEAIKILREKGLAVAAKKADRVAADGIVDVYTANGCTAIIEVNTETDFVAKNASFKEFVHGILVTIVETKPADVAALLATKFAGKETTVEDELKQEIFTIGENMSIRRFEVIEGVTGTYIHGGGSAGVVAKFEVEGGVENTEGFADYAKNVCMQIAAMNPLYVCKCCVPESVIQGEKDILLAQIKNDPKLANKPEQIIEKMVTGRIEKYYDTNCLVHQQYVKEENMTVQQYTDNTAKELGGAIKVVSFVKYEKGEGIEKREDDFASEIEKLVKG